MRLLYFIIPVLLVIFGCAAKKSSLQAIDYKVVIWEKGKKEEMKCKASNELVRDAIIQIVENSDDMLKLMVTDQLINGLKQRIYCLEITFTSPLTAKFGETDTSFSRIFIPINNDSDVHGIVFYLADSRTYFTPPGISSHGKVDLNNLLLLLNITIKGIK